jgi:urease accessory protein
MENVIDLGDLTMAHRMVRIIARADEDAEATAWLTLPYEQRCRSRLRTTLHDGREAAIFLERGGMLRGGDRLRAEDGTIVGVHAAKEDCSFAAARDPWMLARTCYHLGNRHVALQIGPGYVRYQHDHVLDEMVRALGLNVSRENAAFEPEPGAYPGANGSAAAGHAPGHGHDHDHDDAHGHAHAHVH